MSGVAADSALVIEPAEQPETLVSASRLIAASRSTNEIIALATDALCTLTGATRAQFIDPTVPLPLLTPGSHTYDVRGHGRTLGRFELVFAPGSDAAGETATETIELITMVTGTALARAGSSVAAPEPSADRRAQPRGDRRKMDRDFIDHTRQGQVGFIVLRLHCDGADQERSDALVLAVAGLIDEAIRQNDVTYVSGPCELSILLPGATKPEAAMAADRIRARIEAVWSTNPRLLDATGARPRPLRLVGGVTAGRYEDPQRLAERALDALDEAALIGANAIVTDLGV